MNRDDLKAKLKRLLPESVYAELEYYMNNGMFPNLDNVVVLSHFLGQCYEESGKFKVIAENLNYTSDALLSKFPKHFTALTAARYGRSNQTKRKANQPAIASILYADRMGNGDVKSGDGWKHRGQGFIQITGKDNQTLFAEYVKNENIINDPSLIGTQYPLMSALWFFFVYRDLDKIAIQGIDRDTITKVTKKINGGLTNLDNRIKATEYFYQSLKD